MRPDALAILAYCRRHGVPVALRHLPTLEGFLARLAEAAEKTNLTRITDRSEMLVRHLADSLLFGPLLGRPMGMRVADLGCGAGLPSIPLACVYRGLSVVACDASARKVRFVSGVAEDLGLSNIEAVHGRLEDLGRDPAFREGFGACVARACGPLARVLEYGLPLLRPGGRLVVATTAEALAEAGPLDGALRLLGGKALCQRPYRLPGPEGPSFVHQAVVKVGQTPDRFPRRPQAIAKKPLS